MTGLLPCHYANSGYLQKREENREAPRETRGPKPSRIRQRHVLEVRVPQSPSQPADTRARQLGHFSYYRARGLAVRTDSSVPFSRTDV